MKRNNLPSHGALIDKMSAVREKIRALAKQEKALKEEYDDLETRLIASLDAADLDGAKSKCATGTITETEVATAEDWDRFHAWLRKTNRLFMLERRISQTAFREYAEKTRGHKPPPGVTTFTKRKISLRNISN